jgi:hypothetical protein
MLLLGRIFPDRQVGTTGERVATEGRVEIAASGTRDLQKGTSGGRLSGGRSSGGRSSVQKPELLAPTVRTPWLYQAAGFSVDYRTSWLSFPLTPEQKRWRVLTQRGCCKADDRGISATVGGRTLEP